MGSGGSRQRRCTSDTCHGVGGNYSTNYWCSSDNSTNYPNYRVCTRRRQSRTLLSGEEACQTRSSLLCVQLWIFDEHTRCRVQLASKVQYQVRAYLVTSFSHIGACLSKVHNLWVIFVRDACDIENFLVKESGQVWTVVMSTRECLFGRIGDGGGARVCWQGGLRMCRQELSWCVWLIGCMPMSSASSPATPPNSRYAPGGASASLADRSIKVCAQCAQCAQDPPLPSKPPPMVEDQNPPNHPRIPHKPFFPSTQLRPPSPRPLLSLIEFPPKLVELRCPSVGWEFHMAWFSACSGFSDGWVAEE